jgi:hypothetical protein
MDKFTEFPKMARLSREMIVTEKIDGTNAQIFIARAENPPLVPKETLFAWNDSDGKLCYMLAGSRTRWITPEEDNYGFAAWAQKNAFELTKLGVGRHFGEWWGRGIQRKYDMSERRFSLFNVSRWCPHDQEPQVIPSANPTVVKMQDRLPECCHLVPVLYWGDFDTNHINQCLTYLRDHGSQAALGFMKPEGVVAFHIAGNVGFKKMLDNDNIPKSLQ